MRWKGGVDKDGIETRKIMECKWSANGVGGSLYSGCEKLLV